MVRWSVPLRGEGSFVIQFEIGPVGQQADATVPRANRVSGPSNERAQPLPVSDTAMDTPASQRLEGTAEAARDAGAESQEGSDKPHDRHGAPNV